MNEPAFMICSKAKPGSGADFRCGQCHAPLLISGAGITRLLEYRFSTGQLMMLLCNPCGAIVMDMLKEAAVENPEIASSLEILPEALKKIADRDPELAKQLFRKDAETREKEKP